MTLLDVAKSIDLFSVTQTYFGKQGCACGCGGNYHESYRMASRAVTSVTKHIMSNGTSNIEFIRGFKNEYILSLELDTRAIRIYFNSPIEYPSTIFTS